MGMTCKFCEAMKVNRQCDEIDQSPDDLTYGKYMSKYTVAIVAHHWYSKMGNGHSVYVGRRIESERNKSQLFGKTEQLGLAEMPVLRQGGNGADD